MAKAAQSTLRTRLLVGFSLGAVFLLSLIRPEVFIGLITLAAAAGTWELATVMRSHGWHVPRIPAVLASIPIMWGAYYFGGQGQWFALLFAAATLILWRAGFLAIWGRGSQSLKQTLRDFGASAFALIYVPLLVSFMSLIMALENGTALIFGVVLTVVSIDSAGYLVGRVLGRTKMAPGVSPKKTWEGLAASAVAAVLSGLLTSVLLGASPLFGVIFGLALLLSAVLGDLSESLIKRDLGVKDMGSILPGHGGIMDRLDSMLPSAFVGYLLTFFIF